MVAASANDKKYQINEAIEAIFSHLKASFFTFFSMKKGKKLKKQGDTKWGKTTTVWYAFVTG